MAPKTKKTKKVSNKPDSETDTEPEVVQKTKNKKDDEIEMIAVKYLIVESNHPFHKINGVTGSIELSKILDDIPKEEVILPFSYSLKSYIFYINLKSL